MAPTNPARRRSRRHTKCEHVRGHNAETEAPTTGRDDQGITDTRPAEQVLGTTWEGKTFFEHIHGMITDVAGEVMKEKVGEQLASAMGPVNARLAEDRQQMQEATSALAAEKKTRDKLNSKMEKAMAENAKALEKVVTTSNTHNEYLEHLQREAQEERRREVVARRNIEIHRIGCCETWCGC